MEIIIVSRGDEINLKQPLEIRLQGKKNGTKWKRYYRVVVML